MTYNMGARVALAAMSTTHNRRTALDWLAKAMDAGLSYAEADEARAQWDEDHDPAALHDQDRCLCSHHISNHEDQRGQCWSAACGCRSMRQPKP